MLTGLSSPTKEAKSSANFHLVDYLTSRFLALRENSSGQTIALQVIRFFITLAFQPTSPKPELISLTHFGQRHGQKKENHTAQSTRF